VHYYSRSNKLYIKIKECSCHLKEEILDRFNVDRFMESAKVLQSRFQHL